MQQSGGKIEVILEEVKIDDSTIGEYNDIITGTYCKLTISDTGHGIDNEIIGRIFDPYFTTKESGKGTGMGLAVVHGIVKNHSGDIKVFSSPGKGTEFQVYLPIEKATTPSKAIDFPDNLQKGNEFILLVDDEEMIVDIMSEMLEQLGYRVSAFNNSRDALETFRFQSEKYDLVITDMTMPNMTGDQLAKEMKKLRPDIPIIICTGYNESISKAKSHFDGIQDFIMKPVNMKKLSSSIRNILDGGFVERRKYERFPAKVDSFVLPYKDYSKRYNIIDISKSGLAFKYNIDISDDQNNYFNKMGIAIADDHILMDNIPYKTVSDILVHEPTDSSEALSRRCGIKFETLSPLQEEQLEYFIETDN